MTHFKRRARQPRPITKALKLGDWWSKTINRDYDSFDWDDVHYDGDVALLHGAPRIALPALTGAFFGAFGLGHIYLGGTALGYSAYSVGVATFLASPIVLGASVLGGIWLCNKAGHLHGALHRRLAGDGWAGFVDGVTSAAAAGFLAFVIAKHGGLGIDYAQIRAETKAKQSQEQAQAVNEDDNICNRLDRAEEELPAKCGYLLDPHSTL